MNIHHVGWAKQGLLWITGILMSLLGISLVAAPALAADYRASENVQIAAGETHVGDLYVGGNRVQIQGNIDGDLYVAGGSVDITGNVTGGVFAAGSEVRISGNVGRSIHAAGAALRISGTVERNVVVFGGTVDLEASSVVKGDLVAYSGRDTLDGTVNGQAKLGAGEIAISGTIKGNVEVKRTSVLTLVPSASLKGDLNYETSEQLSDTELSQVAGSAHFTKMAPRTRNVAAATAFAVWYNIFHFVALLLVVAVLFWLFPRFMEQTRAHAEKPTYGGFLLRGLIVSIVVPVVAVALLFTIVGIPLAMLMFIGYGILWALVAVPVALVIGKAVLAKTAWKENKTAMVVVGLLITELAFAVLHLIPFIGPLAQWVIGLWGFGVLLAAVFPKYLTPSEKTKTPA